MAENKKKKVAVKPAKDEKKKTAKVKLTSAAAKRESTVKIAKKQVKTEKKVSAKPSKAVKKAASPKNAPKASVKKNLKANTKKTSVKSTKVDLKKTGAKASTKKSATQTTKGSAKKKDLKTTSKKATAVTKPVAKVAPKAPAATKRAKKAAATKAASKKAVARSVTSPKKEENKNTIKAIASAPSSVAKKKVTGPTLIRPAEPEPIPIPTYSQTQAKKKKKAKHHFSAADLLAFKKELLALRDKIQGRSGHMKNAALKGVDDINPEEDGTDAFLRLQTLDQVRSQHIDLVHINEALKAIEDGTYGVCCNCGELIRKQRLAVLPFAKNCIKCQSEIERQARRR